VRSVTFQAMRKLRDQGTLTPAQMACFVKPKREELYDLLSDPQALRNVADDPLYVNVLKQMRQVLVQWRTETADAKPATLTPDKYDRETGMGLSAKSTPAKPAKTKPKKG
jgi:N-sulfoglucosamine sulfohydrolase